MPTWSIADVWEGVAAMRPDADALVHGDLRLSWSDFDRRADGVARYLLDRGAQHQDKVALYLFNDPAYLETVFACCKASLVPVNTNYRYTDDELVYLWDDADAVAVVFHGAFADRIERIRDRLPAVHTWLWVDDDSDDCPDWAVPYGEAAASASGRTVPPSGRAGTDLLLVYTGGTTGMPKGVMWEQDTLVRVLTALGTVPVGEDTTLETYLAGVRAAAPGPGVLACPLMHGTGMFTAIGQLLDGGAVVTLASRRFDPENLLDVVDQKRAQAIVIVGDAFARPILRALDAHRDRWDLSSLGAIVSAGTMWSEPVKQALLAHHSGMMLIDLLSSSEGLGMGTSISTAGAAAGTARFDAGESSVVVTDDGRLVEPGSGEIGRLGVRGLTPVGYYKDPEKTAATFPVIGGVRYSLPGDWATVEADGTITLLGRGSVCINTGGEKVFPEEVEEVLKTHPSVVDAVVVGVPDDRFGEAVTAVVEPTAGAEVDHAEVIAHVKERLASYKAPRHVVAVDTIGRAPNGKVDYRHANAVAVEQLGAGV